MNWIIINLILVEEIYKNNLDELADIVDGDVEAAVKNVRLKADKALENIQVHNKNTAVVGKDINKYINNNTIDRFVWTWRPMKDDEMWKWLEIKTSYC